MLTPGTSRAFVAMLLAIAGTLALTSAAGDSITIDEPSALVSGMSYLVTGDLRLGPDHPPLAKVWAALPLLLLEQRWPDATTPAWHLGDRMALGRAWLSDLNDGDRLIQPARAMIVLLLLALDLLVYQTARRMLGVAGGLLALVVAVFDPGLLAHGHYVTTDIAMALLGLLTLVTFASLLEAPTPRRFVAALLSLAGAVLVKFSWVLLLPALGAMSVAAASRRDAAPGFRSRLLGMAGLWLGVGLGVWASVWACYGFRFSPFLGPDRTTALMITASDFGRPRPTTQDEAWEVVLHDPMTASARGGVVPAFIRFAREHRLLPEAYLYGVAFAQKKALYRGAYLMGRTSLTGWRWYFPIAFALKTPLATLLLILAGLAAVLARRVSLAGGRLLPLGLTAFGLTYAGATMASTYNIGHRHLLPLYPLLFILAGAAAAWLSTGVGRVVVAGACAWLLFAVGWIHPFYLSYFNELAGGPGNGYLYLADSNVDWGQDFKRLAAWAKGGDGAPLKLLEYQEGPLPRELRTEPLWSESPGRRLAALTGGTYVLSVTAMLGVYQPLFRDVAWQDPGRLQQMRELRQETEAPLPAAAGAADVAERERRRGVYDVLRRARLVNKLSHRPPDDRVGYSLFVHRLSDGEVRALAAP